MATFTRLWSNHPSVKGDNEPCRNKQGRKAHTNQCAIRMGLTLTASGISTASFKGVCCWEGHGRSHILRAEQLANWLETQPLFGAPQKRKHVTSNDYDGMQGIVFFKDAFKGGVDHIDLWDGITRKQMGHGELEWFALAKELWFWSIA